MAETITTNADSPSGSQTQNIPVNPSGPSNHSTASVPAQTTLKPNGKSPERADNKPEKKEASFKTMPIYEVMRFQKLAQYNPHQNKKQTFIKEISKVLTEIEQSKKSRRLIYFSNIYKRKVYDSKGRKVGILKDLSISGGERFPEVSYLLLKDNHGKLVLIPWQQVFSFNYSRLDLALPYSEVDKHALTENKVLLNEHIMDKQVVDVNGLKVIRVNDIALTFIKSKLAVVSIDIGTRAMFRRLGFDKLADFLGITVKDHPVPWDSVEPLTNSLEHIHLMVPCPRVSDLHPADVADLFDELSMRERAIMLRSMKSDTAAKVLLECESDVQRSLLKSLKPRRVASIMERLPPNDAANILSEHMPEDFELIFRFMDKRLALRVQEMLTYKKGCAARYMSELFLSVKSSMTIEETLAFLRTLQRYPNNWYYVYVLDEEGVLVGALSLKNLLLSDPKLPIAQVMNPKVQSIGLTKPVKHAEALITRYDLLAIPVVDAIGKMLGVINAEDILDLVISESSDKTKLSSDALPKVPLQPPKRYFPIVNEVEQFMKALDKIKPKKSEYLDAPSLFPPIFPPLKKNGAVDKGMDKGMDKGIDKGKIV